MGALKDEAATRDVKHVSGPPESGSRPVLELANQTDPSLPPPDPNRTFPQRLNETDPLMPPPDANRRRPAPPPEAGPDALDTPEYMAPLPPPTETEHKTFELQTVKIMEEERRKEQRSDPGMKQADIPTAPSERIQRRRSWTMGAALVALGVVAGLGLFALARLTRVEPMEPGTPTTFEPEPSVANAPATTSAVTATAEPTVEPTVEATESAPVASAPEATTTTAPASSPPSKAPPEAPPKTTAAATGTTSTVPLGPPEF